MWPFCTFQTELFVWTLRSTGEKLQQSDSFPKINIRFKHFTAFSVMDIFPFNLNYNIYRASCSFIKQPAEENRQYKILSLHPYIKGIQHSHLYFTKKYKLIALINCDWRNYCFLVHRSHGWHSCIDLLYMQSSSTLGIKIKQLIYVLDYETTEHFIQTNHWVKFK